MPLPEKEYYYLEEIALRWGVSMSDLHYYAVHGFFDVMTWVDVDVVSLHKNKKTEDGQTVSLPNAFIAYKDFAIIVPQYLHLIFRGNIQTVRRFLVPIGRDLLAIPDVQPAYKVEAEDLVISKMERDRFEQDYTIACCENQNENAICRTPSFSGRPSTMHEVKKHFCERRNQGKLLPSLRQEADYLSHWAEEFIRDGQPPKIKTIMNALRKEYRQCQTAFTMQQEEIPSIWCTNV